MAGHFTEMQSVFTQRQRPVDLLMVWVTRGGLRARIGDRSFDARDVLRVRAQQESQLRQSLGDAYDPERPVCLYHTLHSAWI